jgi:hypothetical protein
VLQEIRRYGETTAAALETSLSVEEADRMLYELALRGYLEVSLEHGRLVYYAHMGERGAPPYGVWRSGGIPSLWCGRRLNQRLGKGEMDDIHNQAGSPVGPRPLSAKDVAHFLRRWLIILAPLAISGRAQPRRRAGYVLHHVSRRSRRRARQHLRPGYHPLLGR